MLSLKRDKKNLLDPIASDDSFEDEEIEEGLIKDSVLQLTSDRYDDFNPDEFVGAKLRNINNNADLGSEYNGVNVSRQKITDEFLSDNSSYNDSDDTAKENDEEIAEESNISEASEDEELKSESSEQDDADFNEENAEDKNFSINDRPTKRKEPNKGLENELTVYSKKSLNVHEDIEKGNAIRQQYDIWETLLESRIKLQKCLSASNKLPQNDDFSFLVSKLPKPQQKKISKTVEKLCGTLRTLIAAQVVLMNAQPEFSASSKSSSIRSTKTTFSNSNGNLDDEDDDDDDDPNVDGDDESISSSIASGFSENEDDAVERCISQNEESEEPATKIRKLDDFSKELNKQHCEYLPARNEAIQKWNDKTLVSSGKISNANFSAFDQSTLKQIEQILCDKERLIKKTQTKRSVYSVIDPHNDSKDANEDVNNKVSTEFDPEIFDDDDFYHKLLRDLIDQRSSDITDPSKMGRQWIELQKARSKMKRNIDVKSTKGRRLRYTIHQKLVNFMAPIPYNSYTEEAETELFNSLFGKLKQ